jgi:hypothetical protein
MSTVGMYHSVLEEEENNTPELENEQAEKAEMKDKHDGILNSECIRKALWCMAVQWCLHPLSHKPFS